MRLKLSVVAILLFVLWGLLHPPSMAAVFGRALAGVTVNFGWLYLWVVLGLVVFALWLAFGRYGSLKLGGEDEEPTFSRGSWFAMLFAAGMGIGLVFWGVGEPLSHFGDPPPGIAPRTPEAAHAAMRYSFFHWGLHPLAEAAKADVSTVLFRMLEALPGTTLLSAVATVLVLVFFVTSGDSATLVLGIMSRNGDPDPPARIKAVWGLLIAGIAISLLLSGGIKAVQTATIVFALPFAVVIVLMAIALWRAVREDWAAEQSRERELRRRLRALAERL